MPHSYYSPSDAHFPDETDTDADVDAEAEVEILGTVEATGGGVRR